MSALQEAMVAAKIAVSTLFKPIFKRKKQSLSSSAYKKQQTWWEFLTTMSWAKFELYIFPTMPEHYPLSKKLDLAKSQSKLGRSWDVLLILMSILACVIYVSETYIASYSAIQAYSIIEMVVTQFFAADFLYNFLSSSNSLAYFTSPWTVIDMVTIVPVYVTLWLRQAGGKSGVNLSVFRFVRILRLIRIMRMFKLLNGLSGVQRQLLTLTLTLVSLVFMAAGIIHIMENDVKQLMYYKCTYINEQTNWLPSCFAAAPYDEGEQGDCDCVTLDYTCHATYDATDSPDQPTGISCPRLTFLDAFYFIIVTVATVGYGDISPTTQISKVVVVFLIIISVILIPTQLNELSVHLAANSVYRKPFITTQGESHIIVCGYITDWRKLEKFFKEFFHPDRTYSSAPDFRAVILSPIEPSDDLKALLYSNHFDGKITYIIGTSLSAEDLLKARADVASAMFFFCNAETPEENAKLDDAATVLRTLSVTNFNAHLDCFVQVLKPEDRDILKDSDVDVIMCLDEYKTCMQARNAICPGLSTLVENLFHTFATSLPKASSVLSASAGSGGIDEVPKWVTEYNHGLSMEPYYIPLGTRYCEMLSYEWSLMVEGVFLEWNIMAIGVASSQDHSLILNPGPKEMRKFQYNSRFFKKYNILILLCNEQSKASSIAAGLEDPLTIDRILNKVIIAEETFTVRRHTDKRTDQRKRQAEKEGGNSVASNLRDIIRVTKSWSGLQAWVGVKSGDAHDSDEEDAYVGYIAQKGGKSQESAKKIALLNRLTHIAGRHSNEPEEEDEESSSDDEEDEDEDEASFGSPVGFMNTTPTQKSRKSAQSAKIQGVQSKMKRMQSTMTTSFGDRGGSRNQYEGGSLLHPPTAAADNPENRHRMGVMEAEAAGAAASRDTTAGAVEILTDDQIPHLIDNAFAIEGHIIVFGCTTNIFLFLTELRRTIHATGPGLDKAPAVVIIDSVPPRVWNFVCEAFENVFFIRGKMTRSMDFNRTHIAKARSVVLLAGRDNVTKVEEENLDAEALFSYLKLEKYIPKGVFFTVELTCGSNMAVLNSTVMRRQRLNDKQRQALLRAQEKAKRDAKESAKQEKLRQTAAAKKALEDPTSAVAMKNLKAMQSLNHKEKQVVPTPEFFHQNFTTHKAVMKAENYENLSRGILNVIAGAPARRISSLETKDTKVSAEKKNSANNFASFWTPQDSHQMLAVFASGNAFVPASFDSLLAQSFYSAFTPLLCEKLVCGSKHQSIFQIDVPDAFTGRYFVDLYRAFMSRGIMIIALYRAPVAADGAVLPFVLTSPGADAVLRRGDRLFTMSSPKCLTESLDTLRAELVSYPDGSMSLADTLGIQLGVPGGDDKNGAEETKAQDAQGKTQGGEALPTYRYLQPVLDNGYTSPLKSQVSQVFFKGTTNPL